MRNVRIIRDEIPTGVYMDDVRNNGWHKPPVSLGGMLLSELTESDDSLSIDVFT